MNPNAPLQNFPPSGLFTSLYFCPLTFFWFPNTLRRVVYLFLLLIPPPSDLLLALSLIPGCQCCTRRTRSPLTALCISPSLSHTSPLRFYTLFIPLPRPSVSFFISLFPFLEPASLSLKLFYFTTCPLFVQHTTHGMHFLPGVESLRFSCLYLRVVSCQMFFPAVGHKTPHLCLQGSQVSLEQRTKILPVLYHPN